MVGGSPSTTREALISSEKQMPQHTTFRRYFRPDVARIVNTCSDTDGPAKATMAGWPVSFVTLHIVSGCRVVTLTDCPSQADRSTSDNPSGVRRIQMESELVRAHTLTLTRCHIGVVNLSRPGHLRCRICDPYPHRLGRPAGRHSSSVQCLVRANTPISRARTIMRK